MNEFLANLMPVSVYISKRYSEKIVDMLENDDDEAIQRLIDEDKAEAFRCLRLRPRV